MAAGGSAPVEAPLELGQEEDHEENITLANGYISDEVVKVETHCVPGNFADRFCFYCSLVTAIGSMVGRCTSTC